MEVWGRMHTCRPQSAASAEPLANSASRDMANADDMANTVPGLNRASTTYRYRNPSKRRLYQRDLMRKRRATGMAA
jgi:hypothetical protein